MGLCSSKNATKNSLDSKYRPSQTTTTTTTYASAPTVDEPKADASKADNPSKSDKDDSAWTPTIDTDPFRNR